MTSMIENLLVKLSKSVTGGNLLGYSDLVTVVGLTDEDREKHPEITHPYIMVTENSDYLSIIEVSGIKSAFSEKGFVEYIENLTLLLTNLVSDPGQKISYIFERDRGRNAAELHELYKPHVNAMRRLNIHLDDMLENEAGKFVMHYACEKAYIVLYSAACLLDSAEIKEETEKNNTAMSGMERVDRGQNPLQLTLEGLQLAHYAALRKMLEAFKGRENGLIVDILDVKKAGNIMKTMLWRTSTPKKWEPRTVYDKGWLYERNSVNEVDNILPSRLSAQFLSGEIHKIIDRKHEIVECDGKYYISMFIDEMPLYKKKFQDLFKAIDIKIPYRIKYDIISGGKFKIASKRVALSILRAIPAVSKIARDMDYVNNKDETDKSVLFSINVTTWGNSETEVKRNAALIAKAVGGWGVTEVSASYGDPVMPLVGSVPGLSIRTNGELALAPFSEVAEMLPLERPASLWQNDGLTFFLTEDDKLYPYRIASSLQLKWTDMITGTPGSGKSMLANRLNFSAIFSSNKDLPFCTWIDKGLSAEGNVDLIKLSLPPEKQHLVSHIILENSDRFRVNFLETQLGSRFPTVLERGFIKDMLCAFCIDPTTGEPPSAGTISAVVLQLIDFMYIEKATNKANRYEPAINDEVREAVASAGILMIKGAQHLKAISLRELTRYLVMLGELSPDRELDSEKSYGWDDESFNALIEKHKEEITRYVGQEWLKTASWFDITDALFAAGNTRAAALAHRYAMPRLDDFQALITSSAELKKDYNKVNIPGSSENVLNYIARNFKTAAAKYPVFSDYTRYDLNAETRIIVIDMMKVTGEKSSGEGQLQTGIMYLFARHLAARNYYLPYCADSFLDGLDPLYHAYHKERISALSEEIKHIFYDESHNFQDVKFIQSALNTADLEDRKLGVRTMFSSQYVSHMPESVTKSVNTLLMMRLAPSDREYLRSIGINISDDILDRFDWLSTQETSDGGRYFLAIFRTKRGDICHILKNVMGVQQVWALNSSIRDRKLRKLLIEALGVGKTLTVLAERFPTGSAEKTLNAMLAETGNRFKTRAEQEDAGLTLVETLAAKLIKEHRLEAV
ncbi:TPA: conjugal transfer protein [Serratia marcescens]